MGIGFARAHVVQVHRGDDTNGFAESKMLNVAPEVCQGKGWGEHHDALWKKVVNMTLPFRKGGQAFDNLGMLSSNGFWTTLQRLAVT